MVRTPRNRLSNNYIFQDVRSALTQYMDDLGEFQIGKENDVALVIEGAVSLINRLIIESINL